MFRVRFQLWCSGSSAIALTSYLGVCSDARPPKLFFQNVLCIYSGPCETRSLANKGGYVDNYNFGTAYQRAWYIFAETVECKKCEVVGSDQCSECNPALCCVCMALLFWLLIWHCMVNGIFLEFDSSDYAVVVLSWVVLLIVWTPLLKLYWQRSKIVEVVMARVIWLLEIPQTQFFWLDFWEFADMWLQLLRRLVESCTYFGRSSEVSKAFPPITFLAENRTSTRNNGYAGRELHVAWMLLTFCYSEIEV